MASTIRFLRPWQRRRPGDVDHGLPYGLARGVQEVLVARGLAAWLDGQECPVAAALIPPELAPDGPAVVATLPAKSRPRRRNS